ncbi:DUF1996 domain-containing protein [Actinosynnema pretiosum subsp. pretiosum]|uniref:DUF1996 domain-containing protein n=1 Tax=Actinosynnema pretiosum subsp. pretiosum TaxID=103721 RepID=A0AA45R327_9PSEU|nr:putative secreted protein [Actinosynnema pretiosum subsp. pretiosum]QUF03334.1 DUF1996 domain-containing protein [Actinosynnema pretiosum subsp. pretiosum]
MRAIILGLALLLTLAACATDDRYLPIDEAPRVPPAPVVSADASTGTFTISCGRNEGRHLNADNVVISPGRPNGAHHTHEYVGNESTDYASTDSSLAASPTTCAHEDRSAYYWPVLRLTDTTGHDEHQPGGGVHGNTGEVLPPEEVVVTYRGNAAGRVLGMPAGLRLITGDPAAFTNGGGRARWGCVGVDRVTDRYPRCEAGSGVERTFEFPSCWDGRNVDSVNHRGHAVFPLGGQVCPAGTFPVPALTVRVVYRVPEGRPYAIDSFPEQLRDPRTDHAMLVSALPGGLAERIRGCLNRGEVCG